jgi:catecholate siderophore receptor
LAHIKSRKHTASRLSHLSHPAAVSLMAMALPVAAQTTPQPAEAPKPAAPAEVTLPAIKAKATTGAAAEPDYKADTVASPKFTQPLVDTPQTITVIKKDVLRQQVATSLSEALRNTPGITMQLGENGNTQTGDSIFMRGFDTTSSIFVDGIRDLGSISRDTFNLEQIEVVKGPSGSDNGRGAASGYVNLVSKTAGLEAFNDGSISIGTSRRARATADLNRPLELGIPGSALRLNVMAQDYGTPGRDEVKNKRFGFAPSLAFGLGTPTRATFNYLYIDQKNRPDGGVSTFGQPGYLYGTGSATLTPGAAPDSENYYGSLNDFDNVKLHMFTSKIEHEFKPGTVLRNTTRLGHTRQQYVVTGVNGVLQPTADPATWQVVRSRQGRTQTNNILTNQTNLSTEFATGAVKHSLSTGVEFIYERQNQANAQSLTNTTLPSSLQQAPANLYNPSTGDVFLDPPYKGAYTLGSTLSAALYAFDTLKVGEQWLFTGGLRWEKFRTETNGATFTAATASAPESLTQNAPISASDDLLSWKLGSVFKPTKDSSVYFNVSNAYQPPGGANFTLSGQAGNQGDPSVKPQEATNIELGTKWDLIDGKLAATGAIYRAENKNEVLNFGTSSAPDFRQIGKRRVDGVELGLVGQLAPALNVAAGLALMDPKIISGLPANQGGLIVFSPKTTFSSWVTYKLPMGLTLGGGARYVDTVARSSNVNPAPTSGLLTARDYWIADAVAIYDVNKNISIQFNLNNVFDEEYVALVNNGGSRYIPGQPRNALLTANFKF